MKPGQAGDLPVRVLLMKDVFQKKQSDFVRYRDGGLTWKKF